MTQSTERRNKHIGTADHTDFNPLISINVVYIDYSMFYNTGTGFEEDNGMIESADSAVPVVRIFGSTCSEKRACVHIHGVSY
jgi:Ser-tRNA(Ala) deacylase AlaX